MKLVTKSGIPTRRGLLGILKTGPMTTTEISKAFGVLSFKTNGALNHLRRQGLVIGVFVSAPDCSGNPRRMTQWSLVGGTDPALDLGAFI